MKIKPFSLLLLLIFFSSLTGIVAGETDEKRLILPAFSDELSNADPQMYWILLIVLIAVAVYVYYIWRDYSEDDEFLLKKK